MAKTSISRWDQPSWTWIIGCLVALGLLAAVQAGAGENLAFSPLYVIPVILATWFGGFSRGVAVALGALAAWLWGHPSALVSGGLHSDWQNALIRAFAYIAVAGVLATLRCLAVSAAAGGFGLSQWGIHCRAIS
jgi:hypothetical protein